MNRASRRQVLGLWWPQSACGAMICALTVLLLTSPAFAEDSKKQHSISPHPSLTTQAARSSSFDEEDDGSFAQTTIKLALTNNIEAGGSMTRRSLSYLNPAPANTNNDGRFDASGHTVRRLIAMPPTDSAAIADVALLNAYDRQSLAPTEFARVVMLEDVVRVRDQTLAVVAIDLHALSATYAEHGWNEIEIRLDPGTDSPASTNAGPFTRVLASSVLNYEPAGTTAPLWSPSTTERAVGSVTYCSSVADCEAAAADFLYIVAEEFDSSPGIYVLALHHAAYLGLNVAVVRLSGTDIDGASDLHGFIQDVYASQSAAHFGDGHLGFVLLIGDAYADDNTTVMVPAYYGYGGQEEASDHYYACVAGDDDFEDVMLGRLSVGNSTELVSVVNKMANHVPMPAGEDWWKRTMLVAGLFYTIKDDYVQLFDEYDEIIPDDHTVDRIYRHDFADDYSCAQAVSDAFDDGYLFMNFAGDGWISSWYQTFRTTNIAGLSNGDRLPIALSMACMTGYFDNTTEEDLTGSYDCLAEQLVNAQDKGAIACLAAPRNSDGGMFRTFAKRIYDAAFHEGCLFLGE
ncbi:hypothetical protein K8S17_04045, partial [bacterium]|nr:hypothetical protein [bacterium]